MQLLGADFNKGIARVLVNGVEEIVRADYFDADNEPATARDDVVYMLLGPTSDGQRARITMMGMH
jgi:hypothetical protein